MDYWPDPLTTCISRPDPLATCLPRPDRYGMRGTIFGVAALALVILAGLAGSPILERNRRRAEMRALRTALDEARFSADSCKTVLALDQEDFLRFDGAVDSLRSKVAGYEDPDQGGVPQAAYQDYLETFEEYNDSVENWQPRADSLKVSEARCRTLVEAHNQLGDSIRRRREGT